MRFWDPEHPRTPRNEKGISMRSKTWGAQPLLPKLLQEPGAAPGAYESMPLCTKMFLNKIAAIFCCTKVYAEDDEFGFNGYTCSQCIVELAMVILRNVCYGKFMGHLQAERTD